MQLQRKKLDPLAVRFVATTLILAHGSTTPLDVKNALRQRGYEARQADVSQWLFVISLWERWYIHDNGTYREYTFPGFAFSIQ